MTTHFKACKKCGTVKPLILFPKNTLCADGTSGECKSCTAVRRRANYQRTKVKVYQQSQAWKAANPASTKLSVRKCRLKREFGLSLEDYDALFEKQSGGCAICGESCKTGKRLAVDHEHASGIVRGLCCAGCNTSLGLLKESPAVLASALRYLHTNGKALSTEDVAMLVGLHH